MTGNLRYVLINSEMGWVGILGSVKGLLCLTLPQPTVQEARQLLGNINDAVWDADFFADLTYRLSNYFKGQRVDFPDELDISQATPFFRKVWEQTKLIPYGQTRSYGWLAERVGRPGAARAVGQAMARNPLPIIIPCHRVIASDGKLGGFGGGLEMKKQFLSMEGAACIATSKAWSRAT